MRTPFQGDFIGRAEREIRQLNTSLERRVAERTIELMRSNDQLKRFAILRLPWMILSLFKHIAG
jgi:hypothetical protein